MTASTKPQRKFRRSLTVTLFNVGQGDHILLELPNGEYGIIDFYYDDPLLEPPALTYLDHLRSLGQQPVIAFICISHPDNDHIKGIEHFLSWAERRHVVIREFWCFAGTDISELIEDYKRAYDESRKSAQLYHNVKRAHTRFTMIRNLTESKKCRVEYLQDIRQVSSRVGGEIKVTSIAPLGTDVQRFNRQARKAFFRRILDENGKGVAQRNLISSILLMKYRHHTLIFGGDTGKQMWLKSLKKLSENLDVGPCRGDFIKISHHGSKYSSSKELWTQILADRSVLGISAGRTALQHPHRETLADILDVIKQHKWQTDILSTNECDRCLNGRNIKTNLVVWLDNRRDILSKSVEEGVKLMRSSRSTGRPAKPFAAYVFEFSSTSKKITISKSLTSANDLASTCIYGGTGRPVFPRCATK